MLNALTNSPQCDADPACSDGRAKLEQLAAAGNSQTEASAQNVLATVQRLSTLLQSAGADLRSAGINSPAAAQHKIAQIEQGANALANGSKQLADGVQTLVDQTKQMGLGMNQAANLLLSIKHDASQPSMAGMYIPPQVLTTNDFKNAAKLFISPDRAFCALPRRDEVRPLQHAGDGPGADDPRYSPRRTAEHDAVRCDDIDGRYHPDVQREYEATTTMTFD